MVKKTSILEKLRSRLRSSVVHVDDSSRSGAMGRDGGGGSAPRVSMPDRAASQPATPEPAPRVDAVARPLAERASSRKLSHQEEATVAIKDGFQELASLLRGMQARVDDQGRRVADVTEGIVRLPELGEQQIALLRQVADRLERQDAAQHEIASRLGELPETLRGVREALDRAAATDARTAETLGEFRSHMSRIQDSMGQMVEHSRRSSEAAGKLATRPDEQARELVDEMAREQRAVQGEIVEQLQASTAGQVQTLRDAQADQANRLGKLVEDGTRTNRAILILLGLVFAALVVIAGVLASS